MTREQFLDVLRTNPFKPFEVHVADGDVLHVPHRDFAWISPGGRTIFVARGPKDGDSVAIVDLLLVTKLVPGNGKSNGRKKKSV
jgi:hypothetical protein